MQEVDIASAIIKTANKTAGTSDLKLLDILASYDSYFHTNKHPKELQNKVYHELIRFSKTLATPADHPHSQLPLNEDLAELQMSFGQTTTADLSSAAAQTYAHSTAGGNARQPSTRRSGKENFLIPPKEVPKISLPKLSLEDVLEVQRSDSFHQNLSRISNSKDSTKVDSMILDHSERILTADRNLQRANTPFFVLSDNAPPCRIPSEERTSTRAAHHQH